MVSLSSGEFITTVKPRQTCCAARLPAHARKAEIKSRRGNMGIDTSIKGSPPRGSTPSLPEEAGGSCRGGAGSHRLTSWPEAEPLGDPSMNSVKTSGWKIPNFRWYFSSESRMQAQNFE